jgi:diphthamide synthase subunit DPH2
MYVIFGNSYIMENYDLSLSYFEKAIFHSETMKNTARTNQAKKGINLLNSIWKKQKEFIMIDDDQNSLLSDLAFNKCNFSKEEGYKMLQNVDIASFSSHGKAFYYYYLGVASGNEDYFFKSVELFNEDGEKYFKKLPLIELERLGVKESILKALSI